jgi:hypothetical protein
MTPAVLRALASAALLALAPVCVVQAQDAERTVTGTLTFKNYPRLAAYLQKAAGSTVALDLSMPLDNAEENGHLSTFVLDGQFEIARHATGGASRIYAQNGFDLVDADTRYTLRGLFDVTAEADADGTVFGLDIPAERDIPAGLPQVGLDALPAPAGN